MNYWMKTNNCVTSSLCEVRQSLLLPHVSCHYVQILQVHRHHTAFNCRHIHCSKSTMLSSQDFVTFHASLSMSEFQLKSSSHWESGFLSKYFKANQMASLWHIAINIFYSLSNKIEMLSLIHKQDPSLTARKHSTASASKHLTPTPFQTMPFKICSKLSNYHVQIATRICLP